MDARETWQALQSRLTAARAAVDAGDREHALAEVMAALDIDPHFLAAHSLRDRILADAPAAPLNRPPSNGAAASASFAPPDGYAKFEQRAKRRRVDRRLDAARQALSAGRLRAAATALDEVIELDPNLPDLAVLTAQFDDLRRRTASVRRGPQLVAAAVFVVTVLGASWLRESSSLISRPMIASSPLVEVRTPTVAVSSDIAPVRSAGEPEVASEPAAVPAPEPVAVPEVAIVRALASSPPRPNRADMEETKQPAASPAPTMVPAVLRPVSATESAVVAPIAMPAIPPVVEVDDRALVRQTLQRYRSAYEGLDARSAHAVWPAVNQAALARAFDGLESQTLTFDTCDVRVRGEAATATCQGSARYVPKVGSREPRVEPRLWNFTLHKDAADWKIDSARAER